MARSRLRKKDRIMEGMKKYIAIHVHEYGISTYLFKSSDPLPSEKKVIRALNIDFEPDKDEYIDIYETNGIFKVIK